MLFIIDNQSIICYHNNINDKRRSEMTTYYKATDSVLRSAHVQGDNSVQYELNKFVKPKIGKCMIFDTLEHANNWFLGSHIFECEAKKVEHPPKNTLFYSGQGLINKYINYFWEHKTYPDGLEEDYDLEKIPEGTLFASEVKLTRRIR